MAIAGLRELSGGDFLGDGIEIVGDPADGAVAVREVDEEQGEDIRVIARPNAPDGEPVLRLVDRGCVDVYADGVGELVGDQTEDDGPGMADLWKKAPRALELASLVVDRSRQIGDFQRLLAAMGVGDPRNS
jgi:hypothetical protein